MVWEDVSSSILMVSVGRPSFGAIASSKVRHPMREHTLLMPKQPTQPQELGLSVEVLHVRMPLSLKPSD